MMAHVASRAWRSVGVAAVILLCAAALAPVRAKHDDAGDGTLFELKVDGTQECFILILLPQELCVINYGIHDPEDADRLMDMTISVVGPDNYSMVTEEAETKSTVAFVSDDEELEYTVCFSATPKEAANQGQSVNGGDESQGTIIAPALEKVFISIDTDLRERDLDGVLQTADLSTVEGQLISAENRATVLLKELIILRNKADAMHSTNLSTLDRVVFFAVTFAAAAAAVGYLQMRDMNKFFRQIKID